MKTVAWGSFVLALMLVLCVEQALAIPAFARKYNMSCMTCHAPFPKLKPYGNTFANNGYQLPGGEPPRAYRDTGDDWLQLMRDLPLALRLEGYLQWLPGGEVPSDFQSPYILKIMSGGTITRNVAYYLYFLFNERGEVGGVEDAFATFNGVFGTDLGILIGQYQVSDAMFKRELRLPFEDYHIYGVRPGHSDVDLTYDRGVSLSYGLPSGTNLVLQLVNGSGIGPATAAGFFDTDRYKNLMLRAQQEISPQVGVGAFGYLGKEEKAGQQNSLWMVGPDLTVSTEYLELNAQYVERRDKNPLFASAGEEYTVRGTFVELIYTPEGDKSRYYLEALYNWYEIRPSGVKYQSLTGHVSYLLARNLRLAGEYTHEFMGKTDRVSVGLVTAF